MDEASTSNFTAEGEEGISGASQEQPAEVNEAEDCAGEGQESCSDSQELVDSDPEEGPHVARQPSPQAANEESQSSSEESDVERSPLQQLLEDSADKDGAAVCVGIHAETEGLTDVRRDINKLFLDIMIGELMIHSFCVAVKPQGSLESFVRHLVEKIWADVKDSDFIITPKMMSAMVKGTFHDLCQRWSSNGNTLVSLDLEDPEVEDFIVSSIRECLLKAPKDSDTEDSVAKTKTDPEEFSSVRKKVNHLFVEITVGDVVGRIFYTAKMRRTLAAPEDMTKRLFEKAWAEVKDLDVTITPKKMAKTVPAVFKDLCTKCGSAEKVLFCLDVEDPDVEDYFVSSFRKRLMKPEKLSHSYSSVKTVGKAFVKLFQKPKT